MQNNVKDHGVIRFDREPKRWSEVWTLLWLALIFFAFIAFPQEFMKLARGRIIEDPNFLYFTGVSGCLLLIVQLIARRLTSGNYLRSLELLDGGSMRWTTRRKKKEIPLQDVILLKLHTTMCSPAWAPNPEVQQSATLFYGNYVFFLHGLSIDEFQRLKGFFEAVVYANPKVELVNHITPYDLTITTTEAGA